jgi:alpha-galactosidase
MHLKKILIQAFLFTFVLVPGGSSAQTSINAPIDLTSAVRTPSAPKTPRINGPHVYGERPGHPFLYHLPVTGDRPMTFSAEGLPEGLILDPSTGNITGTAPKEGTYKVTFIAKNALGQDSKAISLVIGSTICLTPPMGWNSWNCFGGKIDETKIRGAADAMVKTGLVDHGWTYINMDDRWEGQRDAQGRIQGSSDFPDMKRMTDYIHGLGLKAGLYSSPGAFTCAGGIGSYQHEDQDAQTYADWGMDYMKYDWCAYREVVITRRAEKYAAALPASAAQIKELAAQQRALLEKYDENPPPFAKHLTREENKATSVQEKATNEQLETIYHQLDVHARGLIDTECDKEPYRVMRASLDKVNRDIVYSLCQYGMGSVWEWGAEVGGNTWRVTGDINASWGSVQEHGFELKPGLEKWAGPGHWNDPDMLEVGNGKLTPDENYTHMTLWCMLAAPLLIGCDMPKMSPFIVSLFSNDEVLAVSQDSLGKQGTRIKQDSKIEVWIKPLDDGSLAVAFFNRGEIAADVAISWKELGLQGKPTVRDLWRQKDLGGFDDHFAINVAPHGAELVKIGSVSKP